jgi:uncharacterized C2H2 Zn-finger protein
MSHSGVKPFRADRLDEVIQRMYLKCPDGVGVMGRDKDGPRHVHCAHSFDYLEACVAGHLDVEKNKIDGLGPENVDNLRAISTFFNDFNSGVGRQKLTQALAC